MHEQSRDRLFARGSRFTSPNRSPTVGFEPSVCPDTQRNPTNEVPFLLTSEENRCKEPAPPPTLQSMGNGTVKNLRELKFRWGMRKIIKRLRGLLVPKKPHQKQAQGTEEWEHSLNQQEEEEEEQSKWLIHHSNVVCQVLQLILTVVYLVVCWFTSVKLVFQIAGTAPVIIGCWTAALLIDILMSINTVRLDKGKSLCTRSKITMQYIRKQLWMDVILLVGIIVGWLQIGGDGWEVGLNLPVLVVLVLKLNLKSELLRSYFELKKYIVMIDSFLLLLVIGHLNALVLFLASYFAPDRNWLKHIGIQESSWGIQYVYSLYWSVTTIVTVGYGDITPQNEYEVIVTIFIELSGSALFGYIINVIGMTMTQLKQKQNYRRKEKESLQEELGIADKLVKCLSLNENLAYRLRSFLKDNQKADTHFSLKDEKRIWDKLKPDLKLQIMQETNIRVIKKCLFFLTYFSRNLQDSIATKLLKRVFQPNETLGFDTSSHNLYIIDQGQAELQTAKLHFNKPIYKILRVINKDQHRNNWSVSSNLFGFTAMILRRQVNLSAVSKEFIITYQLLQKDFDEMIGQYPTDFETVCQLRDSILSSDIIESYEGPEIIDSNFHYVPLKYHLIRRFTRNIKQQRVSRQRPKTLLDMKRFELLAMDLGSMSDSDSNQPKCEANTSIKKITTARRASIMPPAIDFDLVREEMTSQQTGTAEEIQGFDQIKTYSHYFANGNIQTIQKRFNPIEKVSTRQIKKRLARKESLTSLIGLRETK